MADYSKVEKLQGLEFLASFLQKHGVDTRLINRAIGGAISEQGDYNEGYLDRVPDLLKKVSENPTSEEVIKEVELEFDHLVKAERRYRNRANYAPELESHHPHGLKGQFVTGGELAMDEARDFYKLATEEGYGIGTPLARMLSVSKKSHDLPGHISPRTGAYNSDASANTYTHINDAIRSIREHDGTTKGRAGAGMALALATPHLQQEAMLSEAAFNSPRERIIRSRLANMLDISEDELLSFEQAPKPARSKNKRNAYKDKVASSPSLKKQYLEMMDQVLNDPKITAAQDSLIEDIRYGILPEERALFQARKVAGDPQLNLQISNVGINSFEGDEEGALAHLMSNVDEVEGSKVQIKDLEFPTVSQLRANLQSSDSREGQMDEAQRLLNRTRPDFFQNLGDLYTPELKEVIHDVYRKRRRRG